MKVYKAKRKKTIEGRDKPIWVDVGFTMLQGEWEGRTTYKLIDERTGEGYSLFILEKREDFSGPRPAPNDSGSYADIPTAPVEGEVPF